MLLDTLPPTFQPFPILRHPLDTLRCPTILQKLPENEKETPISDFEASKPNSRTIFLWTRFGRVLSQYWNFHIHRMIGRSTWYDEYSRDTTVFFVRAPDMEKALFSRDWLSWGGVKKLVIVISPLKALERDQVIKFSFWVINSLNLCVDVPRRKT